MSQAALDLKKSQTENYFIYHPDSVMVSIVGSDITFPALFDHSYGADSGGRDNGNISRQTKRPLITFYSGYTDSLKGGKTVTIGDSTRTYKVNHPKKDETGGTYQGEAWLV